MRQYSLRSALAVRFALLVLAAISLISMISNIMISHAFEKYVKEQQELEASDIAKNISNQYSVANEGWNIDYIHGMGMYALEDGFIIQKLQIESMKVQKMHDHKSKKPKTSQSPPQNCMTANLKNPNRVNEPLENP